MDSPSVKPVGSVSTPLGRVPCGSSSGSVDSLRGSDFTPNTSPIRLSTSAPMRPRPMNSSTVKGSVVAARRVARGDSHLFASSAVASTSSGTRTPSPRPKGFFWWKRGPVEVSYSSTLLFMWAVLLAVLSCRAGYPMQAATIMTMSTVALTSEHGESRLLMPLVFLAEQCLDHELGLGHSPLEFYSSTVLSYLSLVACKAERRGKSLHERNVVLETVLYAMVGLSVVFFVLKDNIISFGAVVYVAAGHTAFLKLWPLLGVNEAALVSSIVGFYLCDVCINNNLTVSGGRESVLYRAVPGYLTSYTHIASRGTMLCAIYIASVVGVLSRLCRVPVNKNSKSSERRVSTKRITAVFCLSTISIGIIVGVVISYQFRENAVVWLVGYIVSSRFRLCTLATWFTLIPFSVIFVDRCTRGLRLTVRRKLFHFIAVIAFTPAVMIDPPFFAFAISTATSLAVILEIARYFHVYGSEWLSRFISHHIDDRESVSGVVRTHIYLIFGIGCPMLIRYRRLASVARAEPAVLELSLNVIPGIISLGIVDASAAIVGSSFMLSSRRALGRYLKNNLFTERANSSITHKTTTGTLGGFVCGVAFWITILTIAEVPFSGPVLYSMTMILVCTLTECFMDGVDNLQLPLVVLGSVYSLFALIIPARELWTIPGIMRPNPTTAWSLACAVTSPWSNWPKKH